MRPVAASEGNALYLGINYFRAAGAKIITENRPLEIISWPRRQAVG